MTRHLWLAVWLAWTTPALAAEFVPLGKKPLASTLEQTTKTLGPIDCALAVDATLGTTVCADNTGLPDLVSSYGCSNWLETGGERIYRLELTEPAAIEVRIDAACDLDVFLLSGCGEEVTCLASGDLGVRSADALTGEVYVVVDGYVGAECAFCIEFLEVEPLDGVQPEDFEPNVFLNCGTQTLDGTTCGGTNRVEYETCAAFVEPGPESWYRVQLFPGGILEATVVMPDADVALWVLDQFGDPCVAAVDNGGVGEPETIRAFWGEAPRDFYLVVDSFGAECAAYTLDLQCTNGLVSSVRSSWGHVKARYGSEGSR